MINEIYTKDNSGNVVLVRSEEKPDEVLPPNWNGLTQALSQSPLMAFALANANPNGFSLMLKTLSDGEVRSASENFLLMSINACGLSFSTNQKKELNQMLTDNNFTIQV